MSKTNKTQLPKVQGPYSPSVQAGDLVFCSGQLGVDPVTNEFVGTDVKSQTAQAIKNLEAVLKESGLSLNHVVKADVFLKDMNDFKAMNEVYAELFKSDPKPARTTVEVSRLPKDALVEIACVAAKN